MKLNISLIPSLSIEQKMHLGMKQADFLDLSQKEYQAKLEELENLGVFRKLSLDPDYKAIHILPVRRYIPCTIPPADEEISGSEADFSLSDPKLDFDSDLDVESILEVHLAKRDGELLEAIRKLPMDLFRYYFIEGNGTHAEAAELTGTDPERIRYARGVFEKALLADTMGAESVPSVSSQDTLPVEIVAELHVSEGRSQLDFLRERTRYRIDEENLTRLLQEKKLTPGEENELKTVLERIHLVNTRYNLLHEITRIAVSLQEKSILTGDPGYLQVLEEKTLAERLGVHVSWISRLINGKTLQRYLLFRGRPIHLRDLFITTRELSKLRGKWCLVEILKERKIHSRKEKAAFSLTDESLRKLLLERGIRTSRRTINSWLDEIWNTNPLLTGAPSRIPGRTEGKTNTGNRRKKSELENTRDKNRN